MNHESKQSALEQLTVWVLIPDPDVTCHHWEMPPRPHQWQPVVRNLGSYDTGAEVPIEVGFQCQICQYHVSAVPVGMGPSRVDDVGEDQVKEVKQANKKSQLEELGLDCFQQNHTVELNTLRRQLAAADSYPAATAIAAIETLHKLGNDPHRTCLQCRRTWPCPTVQVITDHKAGFR